MKNEFLTFYYSLPRRGGHPSPERMHTSAQHNFPIEFLSPTVQFLRPSDSEGKPIIDWTTNTLK